ncbi:MAG: branched-chain amino acid ABC transporter permease [Alphaproteobacteria bacterium]|nr:branched-chain amino acid ABC transporter permease [Alphaproteobacteria bacterium]
MIDIERIKHLTYVDVTLWLMRAVVVLLVLAGTLGTIMKGRYLIEQWVDMLVFGLTMGGIYALVALGYTMVYGILRLINFAHGDIFMTGAYTAYFVAGPLGKAGFLEEHLLVGMVLITVTAMAVCTAFALLVERLCYRPFRHVRTLAPLICAIGASFVLQHSFRGMYGSTVRAYPDVTLFESQVDILGFNFLFIQLLVIAAAMVSMYALYLIVHKTKMGTAMRAVSEDRDASALMGIDVNKVIIFTFILGGSMAGIGGVMYAFVFKQVYFFMGFFPGIKAFSAAVLGGIGNVPGAMLGGFFLGVVESVGPALFLDGLGIVAPYQLRDLIAFTMLVMVLIFRPQGILGERLARARA